HVVARHHHAGLPGALSPVARGARAQAGALARFPRHAHAEPHGGSRGARPGRRQLGGSKVEGRRSPWANGLLHDRRTDFAHPIFDLRPSTFDPVEIGMTTILAIETSCDETAAAVVRGGRRALANAVASQIELHRAYGGVVPGLASR